MFFFLFSKISFSQNIFQAKFSGSYAMGDHMSTVLSDGTIVFSYDLLSGGGADVDIGLTRIDTTGNIIWTKRISGTSIESGYFPQETKDGNIVLAGRAYGGLLLITKVDLLGNVVWSSLDSVGTGTFTYPIVSRTNGYGLVGSRQTSASTYDTYLLRTDSIGNFIWGKSYGASNTGPGRTGIETDDHGFLLIGSVITTAQEDMLFIKTDSIGNIQWSKQIGSASIDLVYSITQTNDKGFVISFNEFGGSNSGLNVLRLDSAGSIMWVKNYSGIYSGKFSKITDKNEIVIVGSGFGATVLLKTDSTGNLLWNKYYSERNTAATLDIAPDKGYVMLAPNPTFDTLIVIKTDENGYSGCQEGSASISVFNSTVAENPVSLMVSSHGGTSSYSLVSNDIQMNSDLCNTTEVNIDERNKFVKLFPNPASNELNLFFDHSGPLKYRIYSSTAQLVLNGTIDTESFSLDISNLSDGIFILELTMENEILRKPFVVNR